MANLTGLIFKQILITYIRTQFIAHTKLFFFVYGALTTNFMIIGQQLSSN